MNRWFLFTMGIILMAGITVAETNDSVLVRRFRQLQKDSVWKEAATHPISFPTYHPQGMTAVGDRFFMSSVEVVDRKTDKGVGHLFEMSRKGELIRETTLGEGAMYHPGGIDYDGKRIWVPAAEYRPDSASIVYTVAPETLQVREVFRFKDHLGAVSHFPDRQLLVAASWGSRRFYRWKTAESGGEWTVPDPEHPDMSPNGSHYVDYQDMQRIPGTPWLLCSGLQTYTLEDSKKPGMKLGGIDLVQAEELVAHWQVPVPLRQTLFPAWTQNPFYVEPSESGLRFFFVPEDGKSSLHVFEVDTAAR